MTKRKITPKHCMRSIELILQENPNMLAKDILAEQEHDKACYALWQANRDKDKLDLIKDINTNGGFYKGRFGSDQRFYYNITKAHLDGGHIYAEVETIVVFIGAKNGVVKIGDINVEKRKKNYERLENYGLDMYQRTNKYDYQQALEYLENIAKFWDDIKTV